MEIKKFRYNYYRVSVPGDMDTDIEKLANYAIDIVRERTRIWYSNCTWRAERVYGEPGDPEVIFRVCRTRPHS